MKYHHQPLFVSLLLLFASLSEAQEPFKLGAILALTGDGAGLGEACRNGMQLAYSELPKSEKKGLILLFEDDGMQPRNTVSVFRKMLSADKVNAVMTFTSSTSNAVSPLAEKGRIPLIALGSDQKISQNKKYVVNFWVTPEEQTRVMMEEIERRGHKRIARILALQDGVLAIKKAFDSANRGNIRVVVDEEYPIDTKDFKPFISKVKAAENVDAIWVELFFGQVGLFAKQTRQLGVELPLFNIESFEDENEVKNSGGALVGQWYVQADDATKDFLEKYSSRYPGASTYSAANCHDAVLLVAAALRQDSSGRRLNSYLHNVKDFSGAIGTFSSTGDNRFSLPATVKIVTKDGFEKLNK